MRIVVALGGNALLRRGETLSAAAQQAAVSDAARSFACVAAMGHQLVITHGNGPQVGLLALQSLAGPVESAMPLDILGAESEGWIGYSIELALRNALPADATVVTLLTQTLVDGSDDAFSRPAKPIGPVYDEATAKKLAAANHWSIAPDSKGWRRVVASPEPQGILEIVVIRQLAESGTIVICAGGGGIPVQRMSDGTLAGAEAVIDKDKTSALLARQLGADLFIMLTDVAGVYLNYGTKNARMIRHTSPQELAAEGASFGAGSMAPKIEAACAFVHETGRSAAIGALGDLADIIIGTKGTTIAGE